MTPAARAGAVPAKKAAPPPAPEPEPVPRRPVLDQAIPAAGALAVALLTWGATVAPDPWPAPLVLVASALTAFLAKVDARWESPWRQGQA